MESMDITTDDDARMDTDTATAANRDFDGLSGSYQETAELRPIKLDSGPNIIPFTTLECSTRLALPSPVVFGDTIEKAQWHLRSDHFQSVSEIYRVVKDLHTQQKFTELRLVYLPRLHLVVICGKEPVEEESVSQPGDGEFEFTVTIKTASEEEQLKMYVYVVPGSFALGTITGTLRFILESELEKVSKALKALYQIQPKPGWTLAVTDCDQVCYYVERLLTLEQLKPKKDRDRDDELCEFFGANRTINVRRQDRLRLQKEKREMLHKQQEAQQNTDLKAEPEEDWEEESDEIDEEIADFGNFDSFDQLDE